MGGGGGGVVGEQKDELNVRVPSSEDSLLNIICKVLYTLINPCTSNI